MILFPSIPLRISFAAISIVSGEVQEYWDKLTDENLKEYADIDGYWEEFYHLFGFSFDHVDYEADTEAEREIPSISK